MTSRRTCHQCTSPCASSVVDTCSLVRSLKKSDPSYLPDKARSAKLVPKQFVLHVTYSQFCNVVMYYTLHFVKKAQTCNKKFADLTGKYPERVDSVTKLCLFYGHNPITVLCFMH